MMNLYIGYLDALEKIASKDDDEEDEDEVKRKRRLVAGLAPVLGSFSGLAAHKGRGWRTAGGAFAGGILGQLPGALANHGGAQVVGALAGRGIGAYMAHGGPKKKKDVNPAHEKTAAFGTTARKHKRVATLAGGVAGAVGGGAVGAGIGAVSQHYKNKKDPDKKESVRKAALRGGARGAAIGGGVGAGSGYNSAIETRRDLHMLSKLHRSLRNMTKARDPLNKS